MTGQTDSSPDELVPWQVTPAHRWAFPLMMLRTEQRLRAGQPVTASMAARRDQWLAQRRDDDTVVDYDPTTEEGFTYRPRRPGVDTDLVRVRPRGA